MDIVGSALYSSIIQTGGSQRSCHENTKATLWRSPGRKELGPPANSQHSVAIHVFGKGLSSPGSLQMTAPSINILITNS